MLFIIIIVFSKTFQSKRNMHYEEQIIEEACLHNNYFIYNQLEPTSFFWKELTLNYPNTPICLIPDSLIINGKQN